MYNGIGLASVRGTATSGHVQSNAGHVRNSSLRNRTFRNANDGRDENRNGKGFYNGGGNNERHALLTNEALREGALSLALHEKKRRLEVRLMELRDQLEERGWKDDEIEKEIAHEREKHKREEERREQQLQLIQQQQQQRLEDDREDGEVKFITQGETNNVEGVPDEAENEAGKQGESRLSNIKRKYGRTQQFKERGNFGGRNTQAQKAYQEERNERLRSAFGFSDEKHKEGEAFDRKLQEAKRVEKKQRIEKAKRKAERARIREERRQKRLERKESKDGNNDKKEDKNDGKRRRGRSTSISSSGSSDSSRSYSSSSSVSSGGSRSGSSYSSRSFSSSSYSSNSRRGRGRSRRARGRRRSSSSSSSGSSMSSRSSSFSSRSRSRSRSDRRVSCKKRSPPAKRKRGESPEESSNGCSEKVVQHEKNPTGRMTHRNNSSSRSGSPRRSRSYSSSSLSRRSGGSRSSSPLPSKTSASRSEGKEGGQKTKRKKSPTSSYSSRGTSRSQSDDSHR